MISVFSTMFIMYMVWIIARVHIAYLTSSIMIDKMHILILKKIENSESSEELKNMLGLQSYYGKVTSYSNMILNPRHMFKTKPEDYPEYNEIIKELS